MADQQPGEQPPAGGLIDSGRVEGAGEPSTVDAPMRWSGSAAVPPPGPKRSRRPLRRAGAAAEPAAAPEAATPKAATPEAAAPEPTAVDPDDWAATPAVDPWADHATSWDAVPLLPDTPLPPTRLGAPLPPTRLGAPLGPPAASAPSPPTAVARRSDRRGRKTKQPPVNRIPVQPPPASVPGAAPRPPSGPIVHGRRLPAPPPWAPQQVRRPLPPPRRKRRWGRRIALLGLVGVVCCCGLPVAWFQFPAARQYPVTAVLPQSFADLHKRDDDRSKRAVDRLAQQLRDNEAAADGTFAGVYTDGDGKRVTLFGVTGWRLNPGSDVHDQLDRVADEFDLGDVRPYDPDETGVHESCGVGRNGDTSVVVCAWADHGSLATVLLTRRSVDDSADLVARLRGAVLTPG